MLIFGKLIIACSRREPQPRDDGTWRVISDDGVVIARATQRRAGLNPAKGLISQHHDHCGQQRGHYGECADDPQLASRH
jgi:hypothetical protein